MRHRNKKAILSRPADQRKALIRNLLTSFFEHGGLETTQAKAKALASAAEKLVTLVKRKDDMNAIRELKKVLFTESSSRKVIAYARTSQKKSGYTRIVKTRYRDGDAALMVKVELIQDAEK
jgi:large subunit ribosomal protein L17